MADELIKWAPRAIPDLKHDLFPIAVAAPSADDAVGRENIDAEDLILPSLKLLQGMSPEVTQGNIDGAKGGRFYSSLTDEVFDGPIRALLVYHWKSRGLLPDPKNRPATAGLEKCISRDAVEGSTYGLCQGCVHREWNDDGKGPLCGEAHNFALLTPDGIVCMAFRRTALKEVRKFLTAWSTSTKTLWQHPVIIKVNRQQDGDSVWWTPFVRWDVKDIVPPEMRAACREVHDRIKLTHGAGKLASQEDTEPEAL